MNLLQCKKILKGLRQDKNTPQWEIEFYQILELELIKEINEKLKEEFKHLEFVEVGDYKSQLLSSYSEED